MGLASAALVILALGFGQVVPPSPIERPPDHVGYVVRYGPGVMEGRAAANDPAYSTAPAPCYVAYTLAQDRDMARLWLRIAGPAGTITCMVVDLPEPPPKPDRQNLIDREVWAEVGWRQRWICGTGWTGRARDCPVRVWVLR
jgi:hypothetical protein